MKKFLKTTFDGKIACRSLCVSFIILLIILPIKIKATVLENNSIKSLSEIGSNDEEAGQKALNNPPRSANRDIIVNESEMYTFSAEDFYFEDDDQGDLLQSIKISQPSDGYLEFNGSQVYGEIEIDIHDIGQLVYYTSWHYNFFNYDFISFQVSDGLHYSDNYQFSISFISERPTIMVGYVPNQNFRNKTEFSFDIPYDLFWTTTNKGLYITAGLPNTPGNLPEGLWFDGHRFYGSPTQTGTFIIEITAYDRFSSVSTTFNLTIHEENAPQNCKAEFFTSDLNFGYQLLGTTSKKKSIIFRVSDETLCDQLVISSIDINNSNFKIASSTIQSSVSTGEYFYLDVVYTPQMEGEHSDVLAINHNGVDSPFIVDLKGYGVAIKENYCDLISILPCDEVRVNLPFVLEFNGNEGGIANLGFTMADAYSGTVASGDPLPLTSVRGLDFSNLSVENDKLHLTTSKGTSFSTNNNQKNKLGVQFNASKKIVIQTKMQNYNYNNEEGGIWFGLNDKSFVKLVLIGRSRVELRREHIDITSTLEGIENPDQRLTTVSRVSQIYLKMEIDPYSETIEGYYSFDGENYLNVGESYPVSGLNISEMGLTIDGAFAGIQGSHHNGYWSQFSFDNFSIKENEDEQIVYDLLINKNGSGTVTPESGSYKSGSTIVLTATPDPHNSFTGWSGDVYGNENPLTILMDSHKEVIANFEPIKYYLNASASDGGAVTLNPEKEFYVYGEELLITATPDPGFYFESWTGSESTSHRLRLTIDNNVNLKANFLPVVEYKSTRINSGGRSVIVDGTIWSGCFKEVNCEGYVQGGSSFTHKKLTNVMGIESHMNKDIFQSEWMGRTGKASVAPGAVAFSYNIPVDNGQYLVRLHFAEVTKNGQGQRVFDVNIEGGAKELINFDIFKEAGGMFKAVVKEFQTNITDANVTIDFICGVDNAKINAIEIVPISSGHALNSASAAFKNSSETTKLQLSIHEGISMEIYPNPALKGYITVEYNNVDSQEMNILIYNNIGVQVLVEKVKGDTIKSGKIEIELNEKFKRGVYVVILKTPTKQTFKKLIID